MIRALLTRGAVMLAAAAILAPAEARAQPTLPATPAGHRAAAFLQIVRSGSANAVRVFVTRETGGKFREVPMEDQLRTFAMMRSTLAGYQLTSVTEQPNAVALTLNGPDGPLWLTFQVEPVPPHRITDIGFGRGTAPRDALPHALTAQVQAQVVDSIARLFEAFYVVPDSGRLVAAKLRERAAAGAYAPLTTPESFARALTADLRSVNGDPGLRACRRGSDRGSPPGEGRDGDTDERLVRRPAGT